MGIAGGAAPGATDSRQQNDQGPVPHHGALLSAESMALRVAKPSWEITA